MLNDAAFARSHFSLKIGDGGVGGQAVAAVVAVALVSSSAAAARRVERTTFLSFRHARLLEEPLSS
ncbi:MAG: hypothetical protein ACE5MM_10440 [Nitrospiraceae bacterium]